MRCWRMRCWNIWRCWGKWKKPSKPGFTYIDFWAYWDALVWTQRWLHIACEPDVNNDEPIIEVSDPSVAEFISIEGAGYSERWKYYNAYFNILTEWNFSVTIKSKNNPNVETTQRYTAFIPTPIETFTFNEGTLTIPENRSIFTTASYSPAGAYIWQWLNIGSQEWDTWLSIYSWGWDWNVNLYWGSSAEVWDTRTISARSRDWPILDTTEANIVEYIAPESAAFVESSITLSAWEERTLAINVTPNNANPALTLQPHDWNVAGRWSTQLDIVANNAWTTQIDLVDWDTWEVYDTCEVIVERAPEPIWPTVEFVDWDTEINIWETWTLRFRYTNASWFSHNTSDPIIADVTTISSDGEYCYLTYEWPNAGTVQVDCVAWNWDLNVSAWVYVTVSATPEEPTLSFVQVDEGVYWQCFHTVDYSEHDEAAEIFDDEYYWETLYYLPCTLTLFSNSAEMDLADVEFSAHQYWRRDDFWTWEYMEVDNERYDFQNFNNLWNWLYSFETYNSTWWTAYVTLTVTSNQYPNVSVSLNCKIQAPTI